MLPNVLHFVSKLRCYKTLDKLQLVRPFPGAMGTTGPMGPMGPMAPMGPMMSGAGAMGPNPEVRTKETTSAVGDESF